MVKKRKTKKAVKARKAKKPKLKTKRVRAKTVKAKKPRPGRVKGAMPQAESAYTLSFAGGIIILIAGILAILGIRIWGEGAIAMSTWGMAVGIVCGLAILIATATIKRRPRAAGIAVLIFSLIALAMPPTHGLIFGPILSLIASVILLGRK